MTTISNRAELESAISDFMHRNDLTADDFDRFIDAAQTRLGQQLRSDGNVGRLYLDPQLQPGKEHLYVLGFDYREIITVWYGAGQEFADQVPTGQRQLQPLSYTEVDRFPRFGVPFGFMIVPFEDIPSIPPVQTDTFQVQVIPADGTTILVDFYQAPQALTNPGDTNGLLGRYPYLYLWACLSEAHLWAQDYEQRRQVEDQYNVELEKTNVATVQARAVTGFRPSAIRRFASANRPVRSM